MSPAARSSHLMLITVIQEDISEITPLLFLGTKCSAADSNWFSHGLMLLYVCGFTANEIVFRTICDLPSS